MLRPLATAPQTPHSTARQRALHTEARKAHAELEQALSALDQLERRCGELRGTLPAETPGDERDALVELEAQVTIAGALVDELLVPTISRYGELLELHPQGLEVHGELADLYWRLLGRAEDRGDASAAERYLSLLTVHDDGRYVDLIEGTATLEIDTDPDGVEVELVSLETAGGLTRRGATRPLGTTPLPPTDLAPGNYLLELRCDGHAPTRRPLMLRRGSDVKLHITLFRSREIGADFVYVPAGRFRKGGDAVGAFASPQAFVDNFAIARLPVTVGEYMLFLDDLADSDPGRAIAFAARQEAGALADPRLPVTGISCAAAEAYARWLSRRSGVSYRLPREDEWEKAVRGGSFEDGPEACQIARRQPMPSEATAHQAGFRLVRELAGGGGEIVTPPIVPDLDPELLELRIGVEPEPIDHDEARRELLDACGKRAGDDPKPRSPGLTDFGDARDGAVGLRVLAGCSAAGEPLPLTDQQTDVELARAEAATLRLHAAASSSLRLHAAASSSLRLHAAASSLRCAGTPRGPKACPASNVLAAARRAAPG